MIDSKSPIPTDAFLASDLTGTQVGRYVIRERLGAGGMGEVYRALDTQLHRQVALKRLGLRHRDDDQYRRYLLNEARRASEINDQRVAEVFDVLELQQNLFIVMEYVDGVTLREKMETGIGFAEFLPIAIQCAQGLRAAHEKDIVHGDLKPENIMVTKSGEIKLCDFGLARRSVSPDKKDTSTTTTEVFDKAQIIGTPAYMAPETLAGAWVTTRADIFSLGVTFYELLAGNNPFRAGAMADTAGRIATVIPPPLDRIAGVPRRVAAIVSRMVEKDPALRYENAGELLADLESVSRSSHQTQWKKAIAPALIAVALVLTLSAVFWLNVPRRLAPQAARTFVVVPFDSIGSTPEQHFQSEGLSETLNAALVKIGSGHNLQVLPPSSFPESGKNHEDVQTRNVKSFEDAVKELGATLVLTGTVQYSDKQVRVNAILLDGKSGRRLDADIVNADAANPFLLQDKMIESVVRMLGIELAPIEQAAFQRHGTLQPGAYQFYLQGRGYLLNFDRLENLNAAIELFLRALKSDPDYALAFAGLGEAYWRKFEFTHDNSLVAEARSACEKAHSAAPTLATAHLCLGTVYNVTGEHEKAVAEFTEGLRLDPTMDDAYLVLGLAYERSQQYENAEGTYLRAIELRPQYWAAYSALGGYYYRRGRYEEARQRFLQVVSLAPDSFRGYSNLGVVYYAQNLHTEREAISAFEKSLSIRPYYQGASNLGSLRFYEGDYLGASQAFRQALSLDDSDYRVWGNLGAALHWAGQQSESAKIYEEARRRAAERLKVDPRNPTVLLHLAEYNGALNSREDALSFLQRALAENSQDPELMFMAAIVYEHGLKRREDALLSLRKAIERGFSWIQIIRSPSLSELRKDQRFAELQSHRQALRTNN